MAFVSEIMGRIVSDVDGERVGKVKDLLASSSTEKIVHPRINAVVVATQKGELMIAVADVATLLAPAVPLKKHLRDLVPYLPTPNDLYLVRDVLDVLKAHESGVTNCVCFLTDITALQVEMLAALMTTRHCDTVELF